MNRCGPKKYSSAVDSGFTLLEMMIVIAILGLLAAMLSAGVNQLSDQQRRRITEQRLEEIRRALVGPIDRFDRQGRRIIGGYVGDMQAWPDLFEACPESRILNADLSGSAVFAPHGPFAAGDFMRRPIGHFSEDGKRWIWELPRRKLDDATDDSDHIGGLETENEGQPVGLWSDDPYGDGQAVGRLDRSRWRGPYLVSPTDSMPEDSSGWPETLADYYYHLGPLRVGLSDSHTWVDGDNRNELEALEDEKEAFRLKQTDGRLEDGWSRALRFFTSDDYTRPGSGETIFWIISEGPDKKGVYPAKGTPTGASGWSTDADDRMGVAYDPAGPRGYNFDHPHNQDNIVMQLHSHEWRAIIDEINARKTEETEEMFAGIRRALVGSATPGEDHINNGYNGTLCRWPDLYRWSDHGTGSDFFWADKNGAATPVAYTKGQPRGLWTSTPHSGTGGTALDAPTLASQGIGWVGPYLVPPLGREAADRLEDGWGREVLFFATNGGDRLLVLSRGADGKFSFGSTSGDNMEPVDFDEVLDSASYDTTAAVNQDNVVMIVEKTAWAPARFTLNLEVLDAAASNIKALLVHKVNDVTGLPEGKTAAPSGYVDLDGDGLVDDWQETISFVDGDEAASGIGRLLLYKDNDFNDQPTTGDAYMVVPLALFVHQTEKTLRLDAGGVTELWP